MATGDRRDNRRGPPSQGGSALASIPAVARRLPVGAVDCATVDCNGQEGLGRVGHIVRVCWTGGSFAEPAGGSGWREARVLRQRERGASVEEGGWCGVTSLWLTGQTVPTSVARKSPGD